jgi:sugar O-acyltransferase (sialic acid O-acetyltransferase NeuD family)
MIIYGAGGMGSEVKMIIDDINKEMNRWSVAGFADSSLPAGTMAHNLPVLGGDSFLLNLKEQADVAVAFADVRAREKMFAILSGNKSINFPVLIHPSAYVAEDAALGDGTIVSPFCFVSTHTHVSHCVYLNVGSGVGHDSKIGPFSVVSSRAEILGAVNIGKSVYIGARSVIMERLSVGDYAMVGMGSVVVSSVADGNTVFGNPARVIKKSHSDV